MSDEIYRKIKKAASIFNENENNEMEMIVGKPLESKEEIDGFFAWLRSASRRIQAGRISSEQAIKESSEWIVPDDDDEKR